MGTKTKNDWFSQVNEDLKDFVLDYLDLTEIKEMKNKLSRK